jgi:hypothetical protein
LRRRQHAPVLEQFGDRVTIHWAKP